ncbi:MAG: DUF2156 domain-containing protein [Christensenellales bacterium]
MIFHPLTLADRDWMEACLRQGHRGSLEYSFSSNFLWREVYKLQVARFRDYAIVLSDPDDPTYIFPLGRGPLQPVLTALLAHAGSRGAGLRFNTVLEEDRLRLEALYPGRFQFEALRHYSDYIYETGRLATLSGKKLANKRNGINKFMMENRDWTFEEISPANIDEVHAMSLAWCQLAGCSDNQSLFEESCAVEQAFSHFFQLKLDGGLLRIAGKVVAYSMGDSLNEDVYLAHIEKAYDEIPGLYQMINQQFVQRFALGHKFVNREDDTGDEGLRKAKLSYDPAYLVSKYSAVLQGPLA